MDPATFDRLASFLRDACGITLGQEKAYLLQSRLQPILKEHNLKSLADLAAKLAGTPSPTLRQDVIEAMTINETSFFRDVAPFETFARVVLPELMDRRRAQRCLRILCAAASTGQEPYSLAMILAERAASLAGWKLDILGVDIDSRVLRKAAEATYSQFEVQRGLPVQHLTRYFDAVPAEGWRLKPAVRQIVRFRRHNLMEPLQDLGQFDLIFCRNVLIYFEQARKREVLQRLAAQLAPDGYLVLGGAETVLDLYDRFAPSPSHRGYFVHRSASLPLRAAS